MYNGKKVSVIITAAGKGKRLGGPVPKQYLKIGGEPVILKAVRAFSELDEVDEVFIAAGEDYIDYCRHLVYENKLDKVKAIVKGGNERQDSVYNALKEIERIGSDTEYVLIHDGARPFVSRKVIVDVMAAAAREGAAAACVAMKDSLRKLEGAGSISVDRSVYFSVQTPQGFRFEIIMKAYKNAFKCGFYGTDDAVLAERDGWRVAMVEGDYGNIKITTRDDLPAESRVGTGFDVHRFAGNRRLVLGGVEISYDKGLAGHSDADVLVHAMMDALLGAAGLGDIGRLFPDTDEMYKDISSLVLLKRVKELLDENCYNIGNIDITVIAQAPKISPYVDEMRTKIADVLRTDKSRINIKGTTTERLGFIGRREGIAAEAVCSIYR